MKRVFYTAPAVVICVIYGMLILLAGKFVSLDLKAWLLILLPVLSAVLLNRGKRWGFLPGLGLGIYLVCLGCNTAGTVPGFELITGVILGVYYAAMGIVIRIRK